MISADTLTKARVYAYAASAAQANAAGGKILLDFTFGKGNWAILVMLRAANSGTNDVDIHMEDANSANQLARLAVVGSGAGTNAYLPSVGTAANASANLTYSYGLLISGDDILVVQQNGAGAQSDTLKVRARFLLYGAPPTVSKARSTNAADVTITNETGYPRFI